MGERGSSAKRLVLTTVKDDQRTVHIDLFRGEDDGFQEATYLGSLVIDGITARPKQVPDIELLLGLEDSGKLKARATDRETGASKSLSITLESGGQAPDPFSVPDFELDQPDLEIQESPVTQAIDDEFDARIPSSSYKASSDYAAFVPPQLTQVRETKVRETEAVVEAKPRRNLFAIGAIILAVLAVLLLAAFIVYKLVWPAQAATPAMTATPQQAAATPEPTPVPTPSPSPTAEPTPSPAPSAAAAKTDGELKNGSKGVWHRIKWGDTLWDIATRYYGNPWLYKKIAKANKLPNPDLIISGKRLWIPPR
jgi:hypothetical protein